MRSCVYVALLVGMAVAGVQAWPNGAPTSTCGNRLPEHGSSNSAQTSSSSYVIEANKYTLQTGETITLTLSGPSGTEFKGFMIQAIDTSGNVVGSFQNSDDSAKTLTCNNVARSAATQTDDSNKSSVTLQWTAPQTAGQVTIRATVVRTYSTYWTNVSTGLTVQSGNGGGNGANTPGGTPAPTQDPNGGGNGGNTPGGTPAPTQDPNDSSQSDSNSSSDEE